MDKLKKLLNCSEIWTVKDIHLIGILKKIPKTHIKQDSGKNVAYVIQIIIIN